MTQFADWIGRSKQATDRIAPRPARFMAAALGQERALSKGSALPALWHWLYFTEALPPAELGRDGHAAKGGFVPPVALPRRMWAGGRLIFGQPLRIGDKATKTSKITHVAEKTGRSGPLCFVTVRHEISGPDGLAVTEEHDIVYREDPVSGGPSQAPIIEPANAETSEIVTADEVLLFRYSALTFNGHRIHYDIDYARQVEGYAGLVVHGPLIATFLADLAERYTGKSLESFSFRGVSALAGVGQFKISAKASEQGLELWAARTDGTLVMTAEAKFKP